MLKKDITVGDKVYWNTTGAFKSLISIRCDVIDIGKIFVWIHINHCLSYLNVRAIELTMEPIYKVTNGGSI